MLTISSQIVGGNACCLTHFLIYFQSSLATENKTTGGKGLTQKSAIRGLQTNICLNTLIPCILRQTRAIQYDFFFSLMKLNHGSEKVQPHDQFHQAPKHRKRVLLEEEEEDFF